MVAVKKNIAAFGAAIIAGKIYITEVAGAGNTVLPVELGRLEIIRIVVVVQ